MKARLKDIAKIANVSTATVSIILNNPNAERFSDKTKKEVLRIADELNYTPNIAAKSLVSQKSNTIGLIIPDLENPFFSSLAKILEIELRKMNYTLLIVNSNEDYKNDSELIRFLNSRGVDGILIALSGDSYGNEKEILEELERLRVPFVLMDRVIDGFDSNQVIFNNKYGEYLATNYVIEMGHRDIGYISVKTKSLSGHYRHLGFEKALFENEIPVNENLVRYGSFDFLSGYELSEEIINNGASVIIASNDLIAFGIIKKAREMGIIIPDQLSVVGYDNLEIGTILGVNLTTVEQNIQTLASESLRILMNSLEGELSLEKIVLHPTLIIRESVSEK